MEIDSANKIDNPYREYLRKAIAVQLDEVGFTSATASAIETLVEMLQCLLISISQSTRDYTELARRTEPTVGDLTLALIDNGIDYDEIQKYAMRSRKVVITFKENAENKPPEPLPKVLPLPEKHSYIRTATYTKPPTQYEELRTKAAISKRGIESSLSKYLAKTAQSTCNLFDDGNENFLLILSSPKATRPSYLAALNPTDQVFDFEELEYYYELRNAKVDEESEQSERVADPEFVEFDVSPQRQEPESELNSEDIQASQDKEIEKPQYKNPYQEFLA